MKRKNEHRKLSDEQITRKLSQQEIDQFFKFVGVISGMFSKFLLESTGCIVDYKINGEDITEIQKLDSPDIAERIQLAVKEERYEDAAKLKQLLENNKLNES
jgi:hypothetical protein